MGFFPPPTKSNPSSPPSLPPKFIEHCSEDFYKEHHIPLTAELAERILMSRYFVSAYGVSMTAYFEDLKREEGGRMFHYPEWFCPREREWRLCVAWECAWKPSMEPTCSSLSARCTRRG